jgi:enoyl-CoA hydratase
LDDVLIKNKGEIMADYSRFKEVEIENQEGALILTVIRPWTYTLIGELKEIWGMIPEDNEVRVVLLAGSGSDFCLPIGNAPLHPPVKQAHPLRGLELAGAAIHEGASYHMSALKLLLDIPQPIVAAVHGRCTGLAANLVLFCDIVIGADNLQFGDPHITSGLVPGDGGTVIWPLLVGPARAKEYLLTGDLMTGAEAERIGLINRIVPAAELKTESMNFARRLASGPPLAIRFTKHAINKVITHQMEINWELTDAYETMSVLTEDLKEARLARAENRPPKFTGR